MRPGLAALQALDAAEIDRINALGELLRLRLTGLGYEVNGRGSLLRRRRRRPSACGGRSTGPGC